MKNEELREKALHIMELIEAAGWEKLGPKFTKESIAAIKDLAKECKETKLYAQTAKEAPDWIKEATPEELYMQMCIKITNAPTQLHMLSSAILYIPYIADGFEREGR